MQGTDYSPLTLPGPAERLETTLRSGRLLCWLAATITPAFGLVTNLLREGVHDPWPLYIFNATFAAAVGLATYRVEAVRRHFHLFAAGVLTLITAHTLYLLAANELDVMYMVAVLALVMMSAVLHRFTFHTRLLMFLYLGGIVVACGVIQLVSPYGDLSYFLVLVVALCVMAYVLVDNQITTAERLEQSEERFRRLSGASLEGVAILREARIVDANPSFEVMVQRSVDELRGMPLLDLVEPTQRDAMSMAVRTGEHQLTETVALRRDGRRLDLEVRLRRLPVGEGRLDVAVMRDVTERRVADQALHAAKLEAEAANRAKSRFLAQMSHELRTPLHAIIGFSELLKDGLIGPLTDEQLDVLGTVFESGQHLLSLINDVLDLSKVEADKMPVRLEPVDTPRLLEESLMMVRERASQKGLELGVEVEDTPTLTLLDARKVKQILFNLLSNAVKFTPDGGCVTLRARWSEGRLELGVADSGIGIADEDIERIFQPFEQIDNSAARQYEGSGLGLTLVARLAALLGGDVAVNSEFGGGTSFTVRLPAARAGDEGSAPMASDGDAVSPPSEGG